MKRGLMRGKDLGGECAAVVLAGGASTRMGSPKALLPLDAGVPAVCHLARLYEAACGICVVVTGFHAEAVEAALDAGVCGLRVRNPQPERGQLSSLQCGLRALAATQPPLGWFLFSPVDVFDVTAEMLGAMRAAWRSAPENVLLCIPEFEGRHGHPIAARWSMAREFLELSPDETARTVIRRHRRRTLYVPAPDAGVLADYNTPEAFAERYRMSAAGPASIDPAREPGERNV